ncbi:Mpo1-like protein [Roseateles sp.]|uniref:Mpo1-like protein n=1 Tax=Roseateles sp. TaxID=1971397 RepID=UPI003263B1C2
MSTERFTRFADFYPFYLREHSNVVCRRLHFIGSTLVLVCLWQLFRTGAFVWLLNGLLCGYGFAWIGHFFFEKNRPATFKYPLYSFIGDWVMYADIWRGRVKL